MARKCLLLLFLLLSGIGAFAQKTDVFKPCAVLEGLHYKHGKANITIKVTYVSIFRSPDEPVFYYLAQHKSVKYANYIKSCCGGTAIEFKPEGCETHYEATIRYGIKINRYRLKEGRTLYLHCTAYNHIPVKVKTITPFLLINDIKFDKP